MGSSKSQKTLIWAYLYRIYIGLYSISNSNFENCQFEPFRGIFKFWYYRKTLSWPILGPYVNFKHKIKKSIKIHFLNFWYKPLIFWLKFMVILTSTKTPNSWHLEISFGLYLALNFIFFDDQYLLWKRIKNSTSMFFKLPKSPKIDGYMANLKFSIFRFQLTPDS